MSQFVLVILISIFNNFHGISELWSQRGGGGGGVEDCVLRISIIFSLKFLNLGFFLGVIKFGKYFFGGGLV